MPRGKQKLSDEVKLENFNAWLESPECDAINKFIDELNKVQYDNAKVDLWDDWTEFLNKLHFLVGALKVPGRKAKSYD